MFIFAGSGQAARTQCGYSRGIRHLIDDHFGTNKSRVVSAI